MKFDMSRAAIMGLVVALIAIGIVWLSSGGFTITVSGNAPVSIEGTGVVSTANSTSTPLVANATYTGDWEDISEYAAISVLASADVAGTLYFDFAIDTATVDRSVQLSSGDDGNFGIHTLIPVAQYGRVRVVNGPSNQATLSVQTLYTTVARIAQPTSRLGQAIGVYTDVLNTRAIVAGTDGTNAIVTDHYALQTTQPSAGKTAFGETLVAELQHEIMLDFVYSVNPDKVVTQANQSGSITHADSMAVARSGAAADSSATVLSRNYAHYQPGHGTRIRFTALYSTGTADSTQLAGIGDSSDGFFFGYNGTSFGIMHRYNGLPEIRTLTVTTPSTTTENITITLDGNANNAVAVTNSGNATTTANEIAAADYSDTGRGWTAEAVGATVIFTSWDSSPRTGTYSLSGATSAVGTFAQTIAGVSPTEDWVPQADWNGQDKFDGTGITGVTLDPLKGNVFQITYQWLGYGIIRFFIEDPDDGDLHPVHRIQYANANTVPSLSNPTLPFSMAAINGANTSDITVRSSSVGIFTDGTIEQIGRSTGISAAVTLGATSAETPILSIRNRNIFQGVPNHVETKVKLIAASVEHTKTVTIVLYTGCTLTDAAFTDVATATSVLQKDTSATAFSGCTEVLSIALGQTGQQVIDLTDDLYQGVIAPGEIITVTIKPTSGNGAEAAVGFNLVELF
jgi:hypothetical protein